VKSVSSFLALSLLACSHAPSQLPPASAPENHPAPAVAAATGAEASDPGAVGSLNYLAPEASDHHSQSPINIVSSRAVPGHHSVAFHYRTSKEHIQNLGHTVKVTYDAGSSVDFDGKQYDLAQFHFHTPSEHLLDGVTYPMEMHLVHQEHDHPERLLVIGVLFKEGLPNSLLGTLLPAVPAHEGEKADLATTLDASSLFQTGEGYYHYEGSLTTPPYSEVVTWLVLDQVHDAGADQIEALNRIEGNNARHIQDQHARMVDHAK
jgi:carbonic anhydrase